MKLLQITNNMFNFFIEDKTKRKQERVDNDEKKSARWLKKYNSQIRDLLVSKHEKRIQGFAKKMECEPVKIQTGAIGDPTYSQQKQVGVRKQQSDNFKKIGSPRYHCYTGLNANSFKKVVVSKYIDPTISFRERKRSKEINPPFNSNIKGGKTLQKVENVGSKSADSKNNISRGSLASYNNQIEYNISESDAMSINTSIIYNRFQSTKVDKLAQQKEDQDLKALAHNRLYFKSLINYEQNQKQKSIKKNLRQILVKCNVMRPITERKKEENERDLFAQAFLGNVNKH